VTWQKEAARKLQWVTSAEDLVDALHDRDGNVRIVAAMILGHVGGVISEPVRSVVIDGLLGALNDGAQNAITAAEGWEEDEEESFFVSATAAQALVGLGYAADAATVFETARRSGHSVHEQRNVGQ